MKNNWKCSSCLKVVVPKNGKLRCCGITETVVDAEAARRMFRKNLSKKMNQIFGPVIETERLDADFDDPNETFYDYEGIPNT